MNEGRATLAIVRRHIDRRFAVDWAMQFAIVFALAYIFAPSFGQFALPVLATLAAASVIETQHVQSLRRLTFFTVPLFGRQLARAHAIAPSVAAFALPLGYAAGAAARGAAISPERFAAAVCVVTIATLVALSATFRDGRDRVLYLVLAVGAGVSLDLVDRAGIVQPLRAIVPAAAALAYAAVRAFGETLARYDPLPERDRSVD